MMTQLMGSLNLPTNTFRDLLHFRDHRADHKAGSCTRESPRLLLQGMWGLCLGLSQE